MSTVVSPESILKELSQLWVSLGKQDDAGVLRACAMTLIIAAEDQSRDADAASETLAQLIHENPSRAILLRVRAGDDPLLESRVLAQCWMPFGKRQQICCEQIEITASESSLGEVRRVLMGLIAPDLPVVLVCRGQRLFLLEPFQPMIEAAEKVVVDSGGAPDPSLILQRIASQRVSGRNVQDLAWTRLTRLRQAVAALFDRPEALERLQRIQTIEITHAPGPAPAEALYLAGWLKGGIGPQVAPVFTAGVEGEPVSGLRLRGEKVEMSLSHSSPSMIEVSCDGIAFPVHVAAMQDWELVREELSITSHDSIYDDVLARALSLA